MQGLAGYQAGSGSGGPDGPDRLVGQVTGYAGLVVVAAVAAAAGVDRDRFWPGRHGGRHPLRDVAVGA